MIFLTCSFLVLIILVPMLSVLSVLALAIVEARKHDH